MNICKSRHFFGEKKKNPQSWTLFAEPQYRTEYLSRNLLESSGDTPSQYRSNNFFPLRTWKRLLSQSETLPQVKASLMRFHHWGDFKSGNGSSCILPKLFSNIPQLEGWPEENRGRKKNQILRQILLYTLLIPYLYKI